MKQYLRYILVFFLLADLSYSFIQHYHISLDGDMASIILPADSYHNVMQHPFGIHAVANNIKYPATNRYFAHLAMMAYFKTLPFVLQHFTEPIDSIYLSCAIAKTCIQAGLIFLLAVFCTGTFKVLRVDFLIAACLITPLFQTSGYHGFMGIIDHAITYTFFYALAMMLLLLFFLPFFYSGFHNRLSGLPLFQVIFLLLLGVVVSFNSALNPAIILITCFLIVISQWLAFYKKSKENHLKQKVVKMLYSIPLSWYIVFFFVCMLSLYSLYLGGYNSENQWHPIPLLKRYAKLPWGLYYQFTQKLGMPLLITMIVVNTVVLHKWRNDARAQKIKKLLLWIGIFAVIYISLLPFGGYRDYRPNIIRRDSIIPVFLSMFFYYGISSLYIIKNMKLSRKYFYIGGVIVFSLVLMNADRINLKHNSCERKAIEKIAQSNDTIVAIERDCSVMSWGKILDIHNSEVNAAMFQYWRITNEKKLYYHK